MTDTHPNHPNLILTNQELASTVDALRGAIARRVFWMITPNHPYRTFNLDDVREVLDSLAQAYAKALMLARETPGMVPDFLTVFSLSDGVWELIDIIGGASSWDKIPVHRHAGCPVCNELENVL